MREQFEKTKNEYMKLRFLKQKLSPLVSIIDGDIKEFHQSEIYSIEDVLNVIEDMLSEKRKSFAMELILIAMDDDNDKKLQEKYIGINYYDIFVAGSFYKKGNFLDFIYSTIIDSEDYTIYSEDEVIPGFSANFKTSIKQRALLGI